MRVPIQDGLWPPQGGTVRHDAVAWAMPAPPADELNQDPQIAF